MAGLIDDFFERCRAGGVRTLNESGLTPEAYRDGVKRFIDVQVEGNLAFRKPVEADPPPAAKYAKGDLAVLTNGVRGRDRFQGPLAGVGGRRRHADPRPREARGGPGDRPEHALRPAELDPPPEPRHLFGLRQTASLTGMSARGPFRETIRPRTASGPSPGRRTSRSRGPSARSASSVLGSKGRNACLTGTPPPEACPGSSSMRSSSADPRAHMGAFSPHMRRHFPPYGPPP